MDGPLSPIGPLTPSLSGGESDTGTLQRETDLTEHDSEEEENGEEGEEDYITLILYEFKKVANESMGDSSMRKRKRSTSPIEPLNASTFTDPAMQLKLRIPILTLCSCTTYPIKWMAYVGWAIIGVEGKVTQQGVALDNSATINNGNVFHFEVRDEADVNYSLLSKAVDLAAIKRRMSEATVTSCRKAFRKKKLSRRDGRFCVFSDECVGYLIEGTHLLPYARQNEWVKLVSLSRGEREISNINDAKNGITTSLTIRAGLNARDIAILHTPNVAMSVNDVPRNEDGRMLRGRALPAGCRYTLQPINPVSASYFPCNRDAAFKANYPPSKLPSASILHYIYGATVLKNMGLRSVGFTRFLEANEKNRPQNLFPPTPQTTTSQTPSGHATKRRKALPVQESHESERDDVGRHSQRKSTRGLPADWERVTPEDADMLMLLFRMNDPAAQCVLEEHEHSQPDSIREWSSHVQPGAPE